MNSVKNVFELTGSVKNSVGIAVARGHQEKTKDVKTAGFHACANCREGVLKYVRKRIDEVLLIINRQSTCQKVSQKHRAGKGDPRSPKEKYPRLRVLTWICLTRGFSLLD